MNTHLRSRLPVDGFGVAALSLSFLSLVGCSSVQNAYVDKVKREFSAQPAEVNRTLTEADVAHMPAPVRRYLAYVGAIGKPRVRNVRIVFDEMMYRKPGAPGMVSSSEQYNFYGRPARFFFMKSGMFFVPFRVLHVYSEERATMQVRVAGLFNAVDISGKDLSQAETVTILNDMCLLAPAALISRAITWQSIDDLSARVFFENGPYRVSAVLYFNEKGELINFVSDDRSALQEDGSLRKVRWSTPVREYREFNGRKVLTKGEAIWHYPEGNFVYGEFTLKGIEYNVLDYHE